MAAHHGKWLGQALIDEGMCPPNAQSVELHMPVDGAVFIRYDVFVMTEDLPKISRALLSLMPRPKKDDT